MIGRPGNWKKYGKPWNRKLKIVKAVIPIPKQRYSNFKTV
jgi:hypothetical protein